MVSSYMEEPDSYEEIKTAIKSSQHQSDQHLRTSARRRHRRRDSGNGMILDVDTVATIQPPPPYTVSQITRPTTTSNDISKPGALGRKLSDLLLDKEFMPIPPPSPPPISSGSSNEYLDSHHPSNGPSKNRNHDDQTAGATSAEDGSDDGLANPVVREATPAETNAFSRILLPKNVVPRLLRMLQDSLQPKKK